MPAHRIFVSPSFSGVHYSIYMCGSPRYTLSRLRRKANVRPLLDSLRTILSSDRHDDAISGEIAEIIGFDDIDLVMNIIQERRTVAQKVRSLAI